MRRQSTFLETQGERHINCCMGDDLLEDTLFISSRSDLGLTKREGEILRLVVAGRTNKQIARQLSRSERTIEYHRNRLMRKMDAHNPAQLVKRAITMGII